MKKIVTIFILLNFLLNGSFAQTPNLQQVTDIGNTTTKNIISANADYRYGGEINLVPFDKDKWYPIEFDMEFPGGNPCKVNIFRSAIHGDFTSAGYCYFEGVFQAYGWGNSLSNYNYYYSEHPNGVVNLVSAVGLGGATGRIVVYLRGGRTYNYRTNSKILNLLQLGLPVERTGEYGIAAPLYKYPVWSDQNNTPIITKAPGYVLPDVKMVKIEKGSHWNNNPYTNRDQIDFKPGEAHFTTDIVLNGNNKWILHHPESGSKDLFIAPTGADGEWDWSKVFNFRGQTGGLDFSGPLTTSSNITTQSNFLLPPDKVIGYYDPTVTFSQDNKQMNQYGVGWFHDSWNQNGLSMWASGYAGIKFFTGSQKRMSIDVNGRIGIGADANPNYKMSVAGSIITDKIVVKNTVSGAFPDYVFKPEYKLRPLSEVEQFIKQNGHLPNIPKEEEVKKNGLDLESINVKLLEKVEELTLYLIQQQKKIEQLEQEMKGIKKK